MLYAAMLREQRKPSISMQWKKEVKTFEVANPQVMLVMQQPFHNLFGETITKSPGSERKESMRHCCAVCKHRAIILQ